VVTRPLRRKLWHDHTKGMGDHDDPAEAFKQWGKIIRRNADNRNNGIAPESSLIEFSRKDPKRTYKD